MIKTLTVSDFQSWKSAELKFSPKVNVIVGASDSGKSALLRALSLVVFNRPGGDSFISYWGEETEVCIEVEDKIVSRKKGKESLYTVFCDSKDDIEFKAFGTGVPEEVGEIINMNDVSIQRQMDAPFLLSKSAGDVGKVINKAVRLDVINKTQTEMTAMLNSERLLKVGIEDTIADKKKGLKEYQWLSSADKILLKLETLQKDVHQITGSIFTLRRYIERIEEINEDLEQRKKPLLFEKKIMKLIDLDDSIDEKNDLINAIFKTVDNISVVEDKISSLFAMTLAKKQNDKLIVILEDYKRKEQEKFDFSGIIHKIILLENRIKKRKKETDKERKEFKLQMPEVCPLCEQTVKKALKGAK